MLQVIQPSLCLSKSPPKIKVPWSKGHLRDRTGSRSILFVALGTMIKCRSKCHLCHCISEINRVAMVMDRVQLISSEPAESALLVLCEQSKMKSPVQGYYKWRTRGSRTAPYGPIDFSLNGMKIQ